MRCEPHGPVWIHEETESSQKVGRCGTVTVAATVRRQTPTSEGSNVKRPALIGAMVALSALLAMAIAFGTQRGGVGTNMVPAECAACSSVG
jgi:hypothetical protein